MYAHSWINDDIVLDGMRFVQNFENELCGVTDFDDAIDVLASSGCVLGFEGAAYIYAPKPKEQDGTLRMPPVHRIRPDLPDWDYKYEHKEYFRFDPIYQRCLETTLPVVWSFSSDHHYIRGCQRRFTAIQHQFVKDAVRMGLRNGITVPLHLPRGEMAFVCFLSSEDNNDFLERVKRESNIAMLIAHHFHETVAQSLDEWVAQTSSIALSPREHECLKFAAHGKTNEDIADLLGLKERTIRFHLINAAKKLGTTNRAHTIGKAASLGLIGMVD